MAVVYSALFLRLADPGISSRPVTTRATGMSQGKAVLSSSSSKVRAGVGKTQRRSSESRTRAPTVTAAQIVSDTAVAAATEMAAAAMVVTAAIVVVVAAIMVMAAASMVVAAATMVVVAAAAESAVMAVVAGSGCSGGRGGGGEGDDDRGGYQAWSQIRDAGFVGPEGYPQGTDHLYNAAGYPQNLRRPQGNEPDIHQADPRPRCFRCGLFGHFMNMCTAIASLNEDPNPP